MGQVLPPTLHCHTFFLQIGNFGVLYFHAFEADSCETMPSVFVTFFGKTDTNAFSLNGQEKRF